MSDTYRSTSMRGKLSSHVFPCTTHQTIQGYTAARRTEFTKAFPRVRSHLGTRGELQDASEKMGRFENGVRTREERRIDHLADREMSPLQGLGLTYGAQCWKRSA